MIKEKSNVEEVSVFVNQQGGKRLDVFLAEQLSECSRRMARNACSRGVVLVNGQPERSGYLLVGGDRVEVLENLTPARARPELIATNDLNLEVLYEDESIVAVNKPRAMHSVTNSSGDPLTLADCVAAYSAECRAASSDARESGLVQRLDYFTSGVVLAAKDRVIWRRLHQMLCDGEVEKTYVLLVEGQPKRSPFTAQEKIRTGQEKGEGAGATIFHSLGTLDVENGGGDRAENSTTSTRQKLSLLHARAQHVARHQIRVHSAEAGHPLVGDEEYGSVRKLSEVGEENQEVGGFLLHAQSVCFVHPVSERIIKITAESLLVKKVEKIIGK